MGQIVFTIDEDGEIDMKVENINGTSCKDITKPFEKNLGVVTSSKTNMDYYKSDNVNTIKRY